MSKLKPRKRSDLWNSHIGSIFPAEKENIKVADEAFLLVRVLRRQKQKQMGSGRLVISNRAGLPSVTSWPNPDDACFRSVSMKVLDLSTY